MCLYEEFFEFIEGLGYQGSLLLGHFKIQIIAPATTRIIVEFMRLMIEMATSISNVFYSFFNIFELTLLLVATAMSTSKNILIL